LACETSHDQFKLERMPLSVPKRQRVDFEALLGGDGEHGRRVEAATQEHDCLSFRH